MATVVHVTVIVKMFISSADGADGLGILFGAQDGYHTPSWEQSSALLAAGFHWASPSTGTFQRSTSGARPALQ
eukprot:6408517-Prymnesium_polylepis.2